MHFKVFLAIFLNFFSIFAVAGLDYRPTIPGNIDLSVQNLPPTDIGPKICENYKNSNDGNAVYACLTGVGAARYVAERFAQEEGRLLGCMDGVQQGLSAGYSETSEPRAQDLSAANAKYQNVLMKSAVERAQKLALSQSSNLAESTIIKRFRDVVGTGQAPDGSYNYPRNDFQGFKDGFEFDQKLGDPAGLPSDWWSQSGTPAEKYETMAIYELHRTKYSPQNICKRSDNVMFDDQLTQVNLWQYFRAHGQYDFKRYGWNDENRSWSYFQNRMNDEPLKLDYGNIQGKTEKAIVKKERRPGVPDKNPDGSIRKNERGETVWLQQPEYDETFVDRPVTGRGAEYYKNIYQSGFLKAYKEYYMAVYFRNSFRLSFLEGVRWGENLGRQIGQTVAVQRADAMAYNAKYDLDSRLTFSDEWKKNYDNQWSSYWSEYATKPQVELLSVKFVGDFPNGIFQAGEGLSALVKMRNLGLKPDTTQVWLRGNVEQTSSIPFAIGIAASSLLQSQTPVLGKISAVPAQSYARVGIRIDASTGTYSSALVGSATQDLLINEVAEIKKDTIIVQLNPLKGTGFLLFELINPSTQETSASVDMVATVDGVVVGQEVTGKLQPGTPKDVSVPLTGFDPMVIIEKGLSGTIRTIMGGRTLHQASWQRSFGVRRQMLADYFLDLLTDPDHAAVGTSSVNNRVSQISQMILSETNDNIKRGINWADSGVTHETLLGSVAESFAAAKVAGKISGPVQAKIDSLCRELETLSSQFGTWDSVQGRKKEYRRVLNRMSGEVKVKKKK